VEGWPSIPAVLVATAPVGDHHARSEEAQQDIAHNHAPLPSQPEGWQEVEGVAEWRRRAWCEDLSVLQEI